MATPCFYHSQLALNDSDIELSEAESMHAMQSRRLAVGSFINIINGDGLRAQAEIIEASKRKVRARLLNKEEHSPYHPELSIAVALPKGDRQKVMVDMLTQMGVGHIRPMTSEYSVSTLKNNQVEKLQRVAIEACKQSQNPWLTQVHSPVALSDLCERERLKDHLCFYANQGGVSFNEAFAKLSTLKQVIVFIGPEGGFSSDEQAVFAKQGVSSISLGKHILRTETAAIAAASVFLC